MGYFSWNKVFRLIAPAGNGGGFINQQPMTVHDLKQKKLELLRLLEIVEDQLAIDTHNRQFHSTHLQSKRMRIRSELVDVNLKLSTISK